MQQKMNGSLIGELLLGELPEWYVGLCRVTADDEEIVVFNEDVGREIARIHTDMWTESPLDGEPVKDLEKIADSTNQAIYREHFDL